MPVEEKKWNEVNKGDAKKLRFCFLLIDIPSCCIIVNSYYLPSVQLIIMLYNIIMLYKCAVTCFNHYMVILRLSKHVKGKISFVI
jgi:hypothetical protein